MATPSLFRLQVNLPAGLTIIAGKGPLRAMLRRAGVEVAQRARALIRAKVNPNGSKRTQSLPGEPPVNRTGRLASNIKVSTRSSKTVDGVSIMDSAQGKDDAFYARFLETGARGGGGPTHGPNASMHLAKTGSGKRRMDKSTISSTRVLLPRPFLSRALAEIQPDLCGRMKTAILAGIRLDQRKVNRKL
jgi:Bacteriophage HK97-gp10, putative tail-component